MRLDQKASRSGGRGSLSRVALQVLSLVAAISSARAETVSVKYRGPVQLAHFVCTDVTRSSFITRVCYDRAKNYMIIGLQGTYYHYCAIDPATVDGLLRADSMGRYFNANIRSGADQHGPFDCRDHPVPGY